MSDCGQERQISLVPHFNTDVGPVQYNLPGGKVEIGETLQATAIREFQEETGYEAVCNDLLDIYEHHRPNWHSITVGFWDSITGGSIRAEQTPWANAWRTGDEQHERYYYGVMFGLETTRDQLAQLVADIMRESIDLPYE